MSKLLSDEELREKLACIMGGCIGSHSDCYYERISEDAPVDSLEEMQQMITMQIDLINTQKRLYAESVIGEDEPERVVVASYGQTRAVAGAATRNTLRAEQRARIE